MWQIEITSLYKDGQKVLELTRTEARVLNLLLSNPNRIYSVEDLAKEAEASEKYLYVSLMPKLMKISDLPLKQIKGEGWMIYEPE